MNKLKEKLASLKAEGQSIIAEANGVFSAEQTARFDEIKAEIASINAQIDSMAEFNKAVETVEAPQPRKTTSSGVIETVKEAYAETNGFKNVGEFLSSVKDITIHNKYDERLYRSASTGSDEAKISSNPDGGFLVPRGFLNALMKTDGLAMQYDTGMFTTKIPTTLNGVDIPCRVDKTHTSSVSGGFRVYRSSETSAVTASQAQFEQISLKPEELSGAAYATEKLLLANPMAFAAIIQSSFGEEFTSRLNAERLSGTGTGQYLGVMNSSALVTVAKEDNQTADTVNYANVIKMYARMYRPGNAIWMCNNTVLPQLMNMTDGDGRLIWQPSAVPGPAGTLLGRPVYLDENCEAVGDLGDILFVNWSQYLECAVGGTFADESIHVRFLNNERTYKFVKYNDGKPWWNSVLTPKKGSTISPFVTLAAR